MSNNQRMALASLVLSACLQGCAMAPTGSQPAALIRVVEGQAMTRLGQRASPARHKFRLNTRPDTT